MTRTTTSDSSITCTEGMNSGRKATTGATFYGIYDAHQLRLQQELELVNYQMLHCQYLRRQVSQNIGTGRAAASWWPWAQSVRVENIPCFTPQTVYPLQWLPVTNLQRVQVRGSQEEKVISKAQILKHGILRPNLIDAGAVSIPNHQQIPPLRPSQSVDAEAQISTHKLQQYPKYLKKDNVIATTTNLATESSPNQHSQVTEHGVLNKANVTISTTTAATTTTSTESLFSNSGLNNPREIRKEADNVTNCRDSNESEYEKKQHLCPIPGCDKVYNNFLHLQDHILSHAGGKPFVCSWPSCDKRYEHHIGLKRHRKTHKSENRFLCPRCSKGFMTIGLYSKHLKTHLTKNLATGVLTEETVDDVSHNSHLSMPLDMSKKSMSIC